MSLQFLYAGLTSMATFYIQYAVTVYLENPFSRNPHVTCPSKIDDGVGLGSRDRVKVLLVSGVKTSLLKKMGLHMLKSRMCVPLFYCVFLWTDFILQSWRFFFISPDLKYGQRFLVNSRWCNNFFFISICLSWFKTFRKKNQIWTFNISILRH